MAFPRAICLLIFTAVLSLGTVAEAATRRAVIVGIDTYTIRGAPVPRGEPASPLIWLDLYGAVNDANRMRDVLVARYGFAKSDIVMLTNAQASRDNILNAINTHLIARSQSGDTALFYFAGHGSRVRNSLSSELDKLDESIVPADAARGARDIRDKELRSAFNKILDRQASLVAIFDSCHSGSVSRGLVGEQPFQTRKLPIDPRDVMDASTAPQNPWERGALILSAAQDDQLASEDVDDFGYKGGRFSIAFAKVARTASVDEPAHHVFRRIQGIMRSRGTNQDPSLEGTSARKEQALFGGGGGAGQGRLSAAVEGVNGERITLQEGMGAGLTAGSELSRVSDPQTRIRVEKVDGISRSFARVINARGPAIAAGDLFIVDRVAPPDIPSLRVWFQDAGLDAARLAQLHNELRTAVGTDRWVVDPVASSPTHVLMRDSGKWWLYGPTGAPKDLGATLTGGSVRSQLPAAGSGAPVRLYLLLPATPALASGLQIGGNSPNNAIERSSAQEADYYLMGSMVDGRLQYAWIRPWLSAPQASTMPMRTDWMDNSSAQLPRALTDLAVKLGFINSWLQFESAPTATPYPYALALKSQQDGKYRYEGLVTEGESFNLALVRNGNAPVGASRYIYVFAIDSFGKMQLMFPRAANAENRFPMEQDGASPKPEYILERSGFDVGAPFGADSFVMITSSEQISNPHLLESQGVRTRGPVETSLFDLFSGIGARTRSPQPQPVPSVWSIDRVVVVSAPRPQR